MSASFTCDVCGKVEPAFINAASDVCKPLDWYTRHRRSKGEARQDVCSRRCLEQLPEPMVFPL